MADDTPQEEGETCTCSLCDTTFPSEAALTDHHAAEHAEADARQVRHLRDLLERFDEGMDKALTLKREKERLEGRVRELEAEQSELRGTLEELRETRDTLRSELEQKEDQVAELEAKIAAKDRSETANEADLETLEEKVKRLKKENRELRESLDHTEDLFDRLHSEAEALEEI